MCKDNKICLVNFIKARSNIGVQNYQESLAGSVIKATGTVEFKDGLWIGNQEAQNGQQRVHTISGDQPGAVHTPRFLKGQTDIQSALFQVATCCQAMCRVRFPAAVVLGLTQPREVGMFVLFLDVRQNPEWVTHFRSFGKTSIQTK